ncbi:unnamed protein product [Linum tenue]|uniref:F-box domain-containing protein n=1 Tax=Linum tenue TaxID=586396 RepID=A0AAV0I5B2_9ROSI|nr:unnamed protein product [Linum tenue]
MAGNGRSDWDLQLSSLLPHSFPRRRRRIYPQGNPPPALNLFSKLGDDLLVEILIRLPNPRFSCRCKAVCKAWRCLISDPSFNRRFISHHQSRYEPAALCLPADDPQSILGFLPVPDKARPNLRVFDCFKDLLLCGFVEGTDNFTELKRSYFVCNPFRKQWIALPLVPEQPMGCVRMKAVLVCKPLSSSYYNLVQQLGDEPEQTIVYSEYRFCVVSFSEARVSGDKTLVLHVFRSNSRKWKRVLIRRSILFLMTNVVSWDGKVFWMHFDSSHRPVMLASFDPFLCKKPPCQMHLPSELWLALCNGRSIIAVSQGAFHIVILELEGVPFSTRNAMSVWRLEGDGEYWSQEYEMVFKKKQSPFWDGYQLKKWYVVDLHPDKPEILYFISLDNYAFSYNLRTREPGFFSLINLAQFGRPPRVFHPRVACWPTPIPNYEDLQGFYSGSLGSEQQQNNSSLNHC